MGQRSTKQAATTPQSAASAAAAARHGSKEADDLPWATMRRLVRASQFGMDDVRKLYEVFQQLAAESDDPELIQRSQFEKALKTVGVDIDDRAAELVSRWFTAFDNTQNGAIDFTEFILGLSAISKGSPKEKLQFSFEVFDLDRTGQISMDEMTKVLTVMDRRAQSVFSVENPEAAQWLDPAERHANIVAFVRKVFEQYDRQQNGKLSFDEFARAVLNHPSLIEFSLVESAGTDPVAAVEEAKQDESGDANASSAAVGGGAASTSTATAAASKDDALVAWARKGVENGWIAVHEITQEVMLTPAFLQSPSIANKSFAKKQ
eukprot:TRINITY_DN67807_c4_g1_i1.p2 TRINITY_DN67807_c4_g1~~TRINITY_DN67807_c4_g1_i1.p2  ORF type:complete len:320 (-),score=171.98 TRINITY_DN67807_c4_g1_i1:113-1072(-)